MLTTPFSSTSEPPSPADEEKSFGSASSSPTETSTGILTAEEQPPTPIERGAAEAKGNEGESPSTASLSASETADDRGSTPQTLDRPGAQSRSVSFSVASSLTSEEDDRGLSEVEEEEALREESEEEKEELTC